jgi:hypothetical protein
MPVCGLVGILMYRTGYLFPLTTGISCLGLVKLKASKNAFLQRLLHSATKVMFDNVNM